MIEMFRSCRAKKREGLFIEMERKDFNPYKVTVFHSSSVSVRRLLINNFSPLINPSFHTLCPSVRGLKLDFFPSFFSTLAMFNAVNPRNLLARVASDSVLPLLSTVPPSIAS